MKEFICMTTTINGISYMIEIDFCKKLIHFYSDQGSLVNFKKEGLPQTIENNFSFSRKKGKQMIKQFFAL